jgi:hypothetical protein
MKGKTVRRHLDSKVWVARMPMVKSALHGGSLGNAEKSIAYFPTHVLVHTNRLWGAEAGNGPRGCDDKVRFAGWTPLFASGRGGVSFGARAQGASKTAPVMRGDIQFPPPAGIQRC